MDPNSTMGQQMQNDIEETAAARGNKPPAAPVVPQGIGEVITLQNKLEALALEHNDLQVAHGDLRAAHSDLTDAHAGLLDTHESLKADHAELMENHAKANDEIARLVGAPAESTGTEHAEG